MPVCTNGLFINEVSVCGPDRRQRIYCDLGRRDRNDYVPENEVYTTAFRIININFYR